MTSSTAIEQHAEPQQAEPLTTVAYFSMEIALAPEYPTYSGGLGVLAGDTLWSAADLAAPLVGITLAHRKGYFHQSIDHDGNQSESEEVWNPEDMMTARSETATVTIEGRTVVIRCYTREIEGVRGDRIPVVFLCTDVEENDPRDRALTDYLYGADNNYRLAQEIVLGIGGVRLLRALGYIDGMRFHMNEGHSALLAIELMREALDGEECPEDPSEIVDRVRRQCIFTTHTPVPAGHDKFSREIVHSMLDESTVTMLDRAGCIDGDELNMTHIGLRMSSYTNGVAMRHGEVSREMFPGHEIAAITNGVHVSRWVAPPMAALLDRRIPNWRHDNTDLRHAVGIPDHEVTAAHRQAKLRLLEVVRERSGISMNGDHFTMAFARRSAAYKRPELLFHNLDRLRAISQKFPIQVVFAGKAHPQDQVGKERIRQVVQAARDLAGAVTVVYLENYAMDLALWLCAGADAWLNNPTKPHEASGTSGMKAAVNGVPSLSILDGWWIEGHIEGVTGWSIGSDEPQSESNGAEADSLYHKLESVVLPTYYGEPDRYAAIRCGSIAYNGSFFNTQRMVAQYVRNAYSR